MDSETKGDWAEFKVSAAVRRQGYHVLIPFTENQKYDIAVDKGDEILKVQIKYSKVKDNGNVIIRCCNTSSNLTGDKNRTHYTEDDIDGIASYCDGLDRCFWVPVEELNKFSFTLSEDGTHKFDEYTIEKI